jgi:hypothetical protein
LIKFAVKLALVALIANATWRIGSAYATAYRFEDAVHQATQFKGRKTDPELRQQLGQLATEYDVPITAEDFKIQAAPAHFMVDVSYIRPIDVFPGYTYPWPFAVHVDIFVDH